MENIYLLILQILISSSALKLQDLQKCHILFMGKKKH